MQQAQWIYEHREALAGLILALITVAESVVMLIPTADPSGVVERFGRFMRQMLEKIVPNKKLGGGTHE